MPLPRPARRRRARAIAVLIAVVVAAAVTLVVVLRSGDETPPTPQGCAGLPAVEGTADSDRPFVGTLLTETGSAARESRAGIKMAMLEVAWRYAEPEQNRFNARYLAQVCEHVRTYRAAGMQVTLGLGLHFAPRWVLDEPGSRYVNQDGEQSDEADVVFDPDVRAHVTGYLRHLDDVLGFENFWAVRVTSGSNSELFYPSGGDYWAFSKSAQNQAERPAGLPPNPMPGWKPGRGDTSPSREQIAGWAKWYVQALSNAADWQIGVLRDLGFTGYVQLLTPGQGLRPYQLDTLVDQGLPTGLLGRGAVWSWVYGGVRHRQNVTAYVSSVADGSGDDDGCASGDRDVSLDSDEVGSWSATRWISRIAAGGGFSVAGEIPAYPNSDEGRERYADTSSAGLARTAYRQAESCDLLGLYWAHDAQLSNSTVPVSVVGGLTGDDPAPPQNATG